MQPSKAHIVYKNKNDRINFIYTNSSIKQKIIDYLYDNIKNLKNYNFLILRNKGDENKIQSNKYIILPNYQGYNYLMVFIKNKERFYSCLIDRKTLSYSKQNIKIENIKIIPFEAYFDLDIYNGTIFDGIYYYENDKKYFIINDVYMFKGLSKKSDQIKNKLIEMNSYLKYHNSNKNSINISVNSFYHFKDIKEAVDDYKNKPSNIKIRGICFYPFFDDTPKLLYLFDNNLEEIKNKQLINNSNTIDLSNNDININDMEITYDNYILKDDFKNNIDDIILTFEVKKSNEDIYNLSLLIPKDNSNLSKKIYIPTFISYAYIPTLQDSKNMRELFKDTSKLIMDCKYVNIQNKTKWLPLNISSKKYPDFLDVFLNYFMF